MTNMYQERNEASKAGLDPKLICQVDSGLVFLSNMQFLRGYCILQADPVVESINYLSPRQRSDFLCDMALVGDAIMEVTGAYRINYALMGNSEPVLHAHIVPRYLNEPEELRKGLPWSYPNTYDNTAVFNLKRDQALIEQLCISIKRRLKESAE